MHFNLTKNVWYSVGEFLVNIVLIFASYRIVILQGGIEVLGLWAILFAWTSLIRMGDAGMANAIVRFVALLDTNTQSQKIRTYLETALGANIALFLVLSVAGYYALSTNIDFVVGHQNSTKALMILPAMFAAFFLLNISSVVLGTIWGLHLGYIRSSISVGGNLIQLFFVLILVPRFGLLGLALSQMAQHFIVFVFSWFYVRTRLNIKPFASIGFSFSAFREMLNFSIKAQVANISNGLVEPISKILVGSFGGLVTLGLYELAYKTIWLPRNAVVAGATATIPAMTSMIKTGESGVYDIYLKSVKYTVWGVGGLLTAMVALSPAVSLVWIGEVNWDYCGFVAILAGGVFLNSLGAPAYNLATATGIMRNNILVNVGVLFVLMTCGILVGLFAPNFGPVIVSATAIGIGGVWIKILNERLLPSKTIDPQVLHG